MKELARATVEITVPNASEFLDNDQSVLGGAKVMAGGVEWWLEVEVAVKDHRLYLLPYLHGTSGSDWHRWVDRDVYIHKAGGNRESVHASKQRLLGSAPLCSSRGRRMLIEKEVRFQRISALLRM